MQKTKVSFKSIIDYIVVILLFLLSIKKGGFYKTDTLALSLAITVVGAVSIVINFIRKSKKNKTADNVDNKEDKFDIIGKILFLLPIFYMLPIIFGNYASLSGSVFEMIRYFDLYIIYKLVKNSSNKNVYIYGIVVMAIFQGIIGIDGLGNRYLQNFLNVFNSGYLNRDLTRLSATIQYANVVAIIFSVCAIYVFFKLTTILKNVKNTKISKLENIKISTLVLSLFILLSTIVLSQTRSVFVITIIGLAIYSLLDRKNIKMHLATYVYLLIAIYPYVLLMSKLIIKAPSKVYLLTFFAYMLNFCICYFLLNIKDLLFKIYFNCKLKYTQLHCKNMKIIIVAICIVSIIVYIVIGLNITKPLNINSFSKENSENINIYNVEKSKKNTLDIEVLDKKDDSKYSIDILQIDKNFSATPIASYKYYDTTTGIFHVEFEALSTVRNILVNISVEQGDIFVKKVTLNKRDIPLDYLLLPREHVFRLKDLCYGTTSVRDRIVYTKDCIKIVTSSVENLLVGKGGEAFENMYGGVQTLNYTSTEAHNSFFQVLVEIGVLGFGCLVFVTIFALLKSKNNVYKVMLFMFVVHSVIDLNFSYMIGLALFAILLGIVEIDEIRSFKKSKHLNIAQGVLFLIILSMVICILIRSNFAYYMKVPIYNNNTDIKSQISAIKINEKRVNLDSTEFSYRQSLNKEYELYLEIIEQENLNQGSVEIKYDNLLQNSYTKSVVKKIDENAKEILCNDKYDKYVLKEVADIYINNLKYLVKLNYSSNNEDGYVFYLKEVLDIMERIKTGNSLSENAKTLVKDSCKSYYEILSKEEFKSFKVNKYISLLGEKSRE
ncbi:MAG: hypothetical protein RSD14_02625 [Clostridia bacterium]